MLLLTCAVVRDIAFGTGGPVFFLGWLNRAQCRQWLATAATFSGAVLPRRLAVEMSPVTCYAVKRNTASIIKI